MKKFGSVVLLASVVLIGAAALAGAQEDKSQSKAAESRWSGVIVRTNKETSTVEVRKGHITRTVHYDSSTKWTKGTSNVDQSQFSDGSRVICLGSYNDKKEFVATRIDLREPHMVPMR